MNVCHGIDVSSYQSLQDWKALRRGGLVFAVAKASEGRTSRDTRFTAHITGIKAAGLVPGAYHFAWPNADVADNASNYISAVSPYAGPGFTHWLDLERYSDGRNYAGVSDTGIRAWALSWLNRVQAAFPGQRVGLYTSADDIAAGRAPTGWPLWYPAYPWGYTPATYAQAEAHTRPAPSGRTVTIWQFTSTPTDRNLCYLSEDEMRAWADPGADVALTQDDIDKVASATVAKLISSGGVLEGSDLNRIYAYLLKTDGVIPAADDASDKATNPYWAWQTHITATTNAARSAATGINLLQTEILGIKDQLAALQVELGTLDLATFKTRLQDLINSIDVTLHVNGS